MTFKEPWSKRHKKVTHNLPYSFSNSFAEPLTSDELLVYAKARDDQDIINQFHHHSLEYSANGGSFDLRQEIAKLYGSEIAADNILVFAGGQVAIQTCAFALLNSDSHAIVFTPGYQSVQDAPLFANAQVTKIQLSADNNWQIDLNKVAAAIKSNTRYIVINEPANPSGTIMHIERQRGLIALAKKHDIYILSDEAYRLLEQDKNDRLPSMADVYSKGISCCTLSKPWGACGVSIGWLALQNMSVRQKCIDIQYFGTASLSRASEIQAIMTLRASETILQKNLGIIFENLNLLDQFFTTYAEFFEWSRPKAGSIGFVKFKGPFSSEKLGSELAKVGISIKPAYVFADNSESFKQYFRIGFGERKMPQVLAVLIKFVEDNQQYW
jgi:aspartate/methionine/tyrosine aminotransferase